MTSQVPTASSATPATFATVIGERSTPSQPKWSITIATPSWPAIVNAVRPPAPSARTVKTMLPT